MKTLLALTLLASLAGCSSRYDSQVEDNFTRSCQVRHSARFCQCYLKKTEDKLSQKEMQNLEQDMQMTQQIPDKIAAIALEAIADCPQ